VTDVAECVICWCWRETLHGVFVDVVETEDVVVTTKGVVVKTKVVVVKKKCVVVKTKSFYV
jgi:hypothetical protein